MLHQTTTMRSQPISGRGSNNTIRSVGVTTRLMTVICTTPSWFQQKVDGWLGVEPRRAPSGADWGPPEARPQPPGGPFLPFAKQYRISSRTVSFWDGCPKSDDTFLGGNSAAN